MRNRTKKDSSLCFASSHGGRKKRGFSRSHQHRAKKAGPSLDPHRTGTGEEASSYLKKKVSQPFGARRREPAGRHGGEAGLGPKIRGVQTREERIFHPARKEEKRGGPVLNEREPMRLRERLPGIREEERKKGVGPCPGRTELLLLGLAIGRGGEKSAQSTWMPERG